jgi:hypothetical protein
MKSHLCSRALCMHAAAVIMQHATGNDHPGAGSVVCQLLHLFQWQPPSERPRACSVLGVHHASGRHLAEPCRLHSRTCGHTDEAHCMRCSAGAEAGTPGRGAAAGGGAPLRCQQGAECEARAAVGRLQVSSMPPTPLLFSVFHHHSRICTCVLRRRGISSHAHSAAPAMLCSGHWRT